MVRSKWMTSLLAALASTGLALGQSADRIITVQEAGKPAHKCKVLKSTPKGHGVTLLRVLDLETGEVMNLEESPESIKVVMENVAQPAATPKTTTVAQPTTTSQTTTAAQPAPKTM